MVHAQRAISIFASKKYPATNIGADINNHDVQFRMRPPGNAELNRAPIATRRNTG
jgi:hypothetical protein